MRIACVNLAEFPFQLLLRRHPDWSRHPVAVVDRDAAQGVILWSNERARTSRILPGLKYAAALSLAPDLRAGEVPAAEIKHAIDALTESLRFYSPDVEPSDVEPGVFWLGASGLSLLYPSLTRWAGLVHDDVTRARLRGAIVVGFTRFGSYAIANASTGIHVIETETTERERAGAVDLSRLGVQPDLRDTLARLGITTLAGFLALPGNGIRTRFGETAHRLYRIANGELSTPLQPRTPREPAVSSVHLDDPETRIDCLVTVIERELQSLARTLDERGEALKAIAIELRFDDGTTSTEGLQPASPTLELSQIVELVKLRLAGTLATKQNARGVTDARIEVEGIPASHMQAELFAARAARDVAAAARAMARVRAELGDDAVVKAVLRDGHLPEARFDWEPVASIPAPKPRAVRTPPLVRRIYTKPLPFSPGRHRNSEAELIRHIDEGTVRETFGPYIVSGGWWAREVQREYYFVRTSNGRALWMFYDRPRMGWFIQGEVE